MNYGSLCIKDYDFRSWPNTNGIKILCLRLSSYYLINFVLKNHGNLQKYIYIFLIINIIVVKRLNKLLLNFSKLACLRVCDFYNIICVDCVYTKHLIFSKFYFESYVIFLSKFPIYRISCNVYQIIQKYRIKFFHLSFCFRLKQTARLKLKPISRLDTNESSISGYDILYKCKINFYRDINSVKSMNFQIQFSRELILKWKNLSNISYSHQTINSFVSNLTNFNYTWKFFKLVLKS